MNPCCPLCGIITNDSGECYAHGKQIMRAHDIIADAERAAGKTLDVNFDAGSDGLCGDTTCRHDECECWDRFEAAVRAELAKDSRAYLSRCCSAPMDETDPPRCADCKEMSTYVGDRRNNAEPFTGPDRRLSQQIRENAEQQDAVTEAMKEHGRQMFSGMMVGLFLTVFVLLALLTDGPHWK